MPEIQMNIPEVRKMGDVFFEAFEAFEQIEGQLKVLAGIVSGGALIGKGGRRLQELVEDGIVPFVGQVKAKMEELGNDVYDAADAMETGDTTSAGKFRG